MLENKRMVTGLTLGKFAPLTKGHNFLIEYALKQCDKLIVIVYDAPSTIDIPLNVRAQWIRDLYPNQLRLEVIEGHGAPEVKGDTDGIKALQEKYVLSLLKGRKIDKFFSSEFYGVHMSKALKAENILVDGQRKEIPICATQIRASAYNYKRFIHPMVYRDLIKNIVFVGAPSTGKTTISKLMAYRKNTMWQPEYGREYWEKNNISRRLTLEQLVEIAEGHIDREESTIQLSNKYLFTDTNAITTYLFSLYYHGEAHPVLKLLAKEAEKRYDLVFLCDTDIPYDDTWDRSGEANRYVFQRMFINELNTRKVPYITLSGSITKRIDTIESYLK